MLGNTNPICFIDNDTIIPLKDVPNYIDKHDIYYIPNIGGTKSEDITEFKTFFVDLDAGKDSQGNFLAGKKVRDFKSKQWEKIYGFKFQPNSVIETRNGFHLYWFLRETIDADLWQKIEDALVDYFDGDVRVKTPAKQLRMPYTYWRKDPSRPYYCKLLKTNDVYTDVESFCKFFKISTSEKSEKKKTSEKTEKKKTKFQYVKPTTPKSKHKYNTKTFTNYKEAFEFITTEVSMFDYLQDFYGLRGNSPRSFRCIMHNDTHPSASIFKVDSGLELYCCNATSCGFKGNIVQVVAEKDNIKRSEAMEKICNDLNIKYIKDSKLEELLNDNLRTIRDDIKYSHANLYGTVYRYLPTLKELHSIAKDSLKFAETEKKFLFSASIKYITGELGRKDKKYITENIAFLSLLKLIEKVDLETDSDVPKEYEQYIRKFQRDKENYITVFSIPYYSHSKLNECEDVAKQIKAKGLRKAHFSYETVANAFDKETADRVFPQVKGKHIKAIDRFLVQTMEFLLENDGYFTLNTIKSFYKDNEIFFREKTYIRQLPAIMQQLNLEKVKATKKIKEEYNILSAGYPYIFIKKGN